MPRSKTFVSRGILPPGYVYYAPEIGYDSDNTPYLLYFGDEIAMDSDGVPYLR